MDAIQRKFGLSALSAALMTTSGPALASDPEVDELIKPESSVSVGLGTWSADRPRQGVYDGMRDGRGYGLFDADLIRRDDATGTWLTLRARNLGLATRELRGEYLRQGNFGVSLEYNQIPRDDPFSYNTRLQGAGSTTQTVSTNASPGPLQTLQLGTERSQLNLGFVKHLSPQWTFNIDFRHEDKTGTRAWGRGSQAEFAVEPIDSTTRQIDARLSYTTRTFQVSGGYNGSWYGNRNGMVALTNAGLPVSAANTTYLSLPLDNQAHQLFVNAGYTFTPTTRATFKASHTRATQNESLPTQDVAGLSFAGAPSRLNGRIDTTLLQLGLSSRPIRDLSLTANLRYHDVSDETPAARFVQPAAGCSAASQCVDSTPFSYRTVTGKLEGSYRLTNVYRLTAGLEERRQNRSIPVANAFGPNGTDTQRVVPMRSNVDETTARVELRRLLSETLNGAVSYAHSRRAGSSYVTAAGPGSGTSPGLVGDVSNMINPLNIADRNRDKFRLALDWAPLQNMSLQFNVEESRDEYGHGADRPFGLIDGTARLLGMDATYSFNERWQVNAWYSYDYNQGRQRNVRIGTTGAAATATGIKDYSLKDTGNSVGLGVRGEVTSRFRIGADLRWARNIGRYDQNIDWISPGTTYVAGVSETLPAIENRLIRASMFVMYALDKNSDLRFDVIHERWRTNDWSWLFSSGLPFQYGTTTDGTTVTANPKQTASFVGVRYIYRFQ